MSQLKKLLDGKLPKLLEGKSARSKLGVLLRRNGVRTSSEFQRVLDLPRRTWTEQDAEALAEELTPLLKEPGGEQKLFPIQAMALKELHDFKGGLGPIVVGGGKTLITFLAPTVIEAERPVLILPASLRSKTEKEFRKLERHWWGRAAGIKLLNYEMLSRAKGMETLSAINPDFIMADECHRLKNPRAACTKRIIRWMDNRPDTKFLGVSGTITNRSLKDYAHILEWCLPRHCPLPVRWNVLTEWCQAVDEKINNRLAPGVLEQLFNEDERRQASQGDELAAVRSAVRRRVVETPGVVASSDVTLGCSLRVSSVDPSYPDGTDQLFQDMRTTWETPYGEPIADPVAMWRHAQELALGFTYRWDPPAPAEWLIKRKLWAQHCRHILRHNQKELDSELPVINAVLRGEYDGKILWEDGMSLADIPVDQVLAEWRGVKPMFKPNTVPVWYDRTALDFAARWMDKRPGICWTAHSAFAEKLSEETGRPYFGQKGYCKKEKCEIEDWASKKGSIIASIGSNKDGRNLQHQWNRSLVMAPPSNGKDWEQMLGRTHRTGQKADEVTYEVFLGCAEMLGAIGQSISDAKNIEAGQQRQKLLYADVCVDFESKIYASGPRWVRG